MPVSNVVTVYHKQNVYSIVMLFCSFRSLHSGFGTFLLDLDPGLLKIFTGSNFGYVGYTGTTASKIL